MKQVTLYCDGSSLGNPGAGGYCGILTFGKHQKIIKGGEPHTTNNRMELLAVIESLKALTEPCIVEVYSDSQYVCNGINEWLEKWVAKNFREVKNPDLWRAYIEVASPHTISAHWVKAHAGNPQNELCDTLAREMAHFYARGADSEHSSEGGGLFSESALSPYAH